MSNLFPQGTEEALAEVGKTMDLIGERIGKAMRDFSGLLTTDVRRTVYTKLLLKTAHASLAYHILYLTGRQLTELEALMRTLTLTLGVDRSDISSEEFLRVKAFIDKINREDAAYYKRKQKYQKRYKSRKIN